MDSGCRAERRPSGCGYQPAGEATGVLHPGRARQRRDRARGTAETSPRTSPTKRTINLRLQIMTWTIRPIIIAIRETAAPTQGYSHAAVEVAAKSKKLAKRTPLPRLPRGPRFGIGARSLVNARPVRRARSCHDPLVRQPASYRRLSGCWRLMLSPGVGAVGRAARPPVRPSSSAPHR
jgi:hypothetical protein